MRARVENNVVVEIIRSIPGFTIEQCFHPDVIAASVAAPIDVEIGWVFGDDGTIKDTEGIVKYPFPEAIEEPAPVVEETPPAE